MPDLPAIRWLFCAITDAPAGAGLTVRPFVVGVTEIEVLALATGTIAPARKAEIDHALVELTYAAVYAPVAGHA